MSTKYNPVRRSSNARHHDMFRVETNLRQSHVNSTEQVLDALKPISRRLDIIAQNETSASMGRTSMSTAVEALRESNLELRNSLGSRIDGLVSSVSRATLPGDSIPSDILFGPAAGDVLARIFRTQLKEIVIPIVEDSLNSYKSASEAQIIAIRESIDSMANEFHQSMQGVCGQDKDPTFHDPGPEIAELGTNNRDHLQGSTAGSFDICQYPETFRENNSSTLDSEKRLWIRHWGFRWRVGILQVTVSAFKIDRHYQTVSNAYQIKTTEPRMAYRVLITFIPTQSCLTLRGISISSRSQRDQRGYLELCPMLSSFAVIPGDSDVFVMSIKGDVDGLRHLFLNRAGSPTDRNERGWTPLHVGALK